MMSRESIRDIRERHDEEVARIRRETQAKVELLQRQIANPPDYAATIESLQTELEMRTRELEELRAESARLQAQIAKEQAAAMEAEEVRRAIADLDEQYRAVMAELTDRRHGLSERLIGRRKYGPTIDTGPRRKIEQRPMDKHERLIAELKVELSAKASDIESLQRQLSQAQQQTREAVADAARSRKALAEALREGQRLTRELGHAQQIRALLVKKFGCGP